MGITKIILLIIFGSLGIAFLISMLFVIGLGILFSIKEIIRISSEIKKVENREINNNRRSK